MAGTTIQIKETTLNIADKSFGNLFQVTLNCLSKSLSHWDTKPKKEMVILFNHTHK
jgi:hypothetical protein